jgi:signal transduction histidine kinase
VFDRVVDNLLTNAAKYTDRGSIVVEVGGVPGFLTIKVSDTGKGIESTDIERIFQAEGSDQSKRAPHSFGVGLSVVVQLLAQIGGRLDVMSKPHSGTTFWAHFPVEAQTPVRPTMASGEREILHRVVTVRKAEGT